MRTAVLIIAALLALRAFAQPPPIATFTVPGGICETFAQGQGFAAWASVALAHATPQPATNQAPGQTLTRRALRRIKHRRLHGFVCFVGREGDFTAIGALVDGRGRLVCQVRGQLVCQRPECLKLLICGLHAQGPTDLWSPPVAQHRLDHIRLR